MPGKESQAEELFKQLLPKTALIINEEAFKEIHGFYLKDYLGNRSHFATICRKTADHIEKVVHDTGIAKTTGGAIGIGAGAAALGGLILAPFTAGASLALTVGGITGGVVSAGTSVTAELVKSGNIKSDEAEVKEALKTFEGQEKIIGELFTSIGEDMKKLRELMADPSVQEMMMKIGKEVKSIGWDVVYQGINVVRTVEAVNLAQGVSKIIQADFNAMTGIAEGMAAPGIGDIFGRALITAGSTTAKVLSGFIGAVGIGMGIWDVVEGAKDINGSEVAEAYRKFADDYEQQTGDLKGGIDALKKTATG